LFLWYTNTMLSYIKWLLKGKPTVKYEGFHCGCCGRWNDIEVEIPEYLSEGKWWDTWGICPIGEGCRTCRTFMPPKPPPLRKVKEGKTLK
jgi:hypothetical protein